MARKPEWLKRMDNLWIFHPDRWPGSEWLGRSVGLSAVTVFLLMKLLQFHRFPQSYTAAHRFYSTLTFSRGVPIFSEMDIGLMWLVKLLVWLVESGILIGYAAAYLTRVKPVDVARGLLQTFFPIFVAGIPVLMAQAPARHFWGMAYSSPGYLGLYLGVMGLMVAGGAVNLIGLLTLRRSFTIMAEARELVRRGIYRFVRHPLYLGHFLMFFAGLLLRWHWYTVAMYVVFFIGQVFRARIEEDKLRLAFPDYAAYSRNTGMFFPRIHPLPSSTKRVA